VTSIEYMPRRLWRLPFDVVVWTVEAIRNQPDPDTGTTVCCRRRHFVGVVEGVALRMGIELSMEQRIDLDLIFCPHLRADARWWMRHGVHPDVHALDA
jgi:hypothetical protein